MSALIKASTFCPSEGILCYDWCTQAERREIQACFLYASRLPCTEAGSYRDIRALCCHAPPVRRVGQLSAAAPWYLSASPLPVERNRFTRAKFVLAGEVTLQPRVETLFFAWWPCWPLQRANLKMAVRLSLPQDSSSGLCLQSKGTGTGVNPHQRFSYMLRDTEL